MGVYTANAYNETSKMQDIPAFPAHKLGNCC
eukprot:CAMPEP_0172791798 /NCGR_PEP_ID=MMETSP1074-20121228/208651_1 /TAXON_ID=2916 /ORGANISM="Ceratium fusus, Strain PA161109" /LENGTH=30 /DNA_ID= /DNA_START= /DNA_END= /DNA_ORIENTATION=